MPIRAECSKCSKQYSLKDEYAGKKIRCPACKGVIDVPLISKVSSSRRREIDKQKVSAEKVRAAVKPPSERGIACPSCGKQMPTVAVTCPHCKFNRKLGRRLSLSDAIESADRKPGVRADGTHYKTRKDKAIERSQMGRSMRSVIRSVLLLVVIAVGATVGVVAYLGSRTENLTLLIEKNDIGLVGDKPETFHPFRVGSRFEISIPLDQVYLEEIPPKAVGNEENASSHFAEACRLPYSKTEITILSSHGTVVQAMADHNEWTFTPDKLESSLPVGKLVVWRRTSDLKSKGALVGAVIDFGKNFPNWEKRLTDALAKTREAVAKRNAVIDGLMEKARKAGKLEGEMPDGLEGEERFMTLEQLFRKRFEEQTPPAKIQRLVIRKADLQFICSRSRAMRGGVGSYADAVREGFSYVRDPETTRTIDPSNQADVWHFHPVIVVGNAAIQDNE